MNGSPITESDWKLQKIHIKYRITDWRMIEYFSVCTAFFIWSYQIQYDRIRVHARMRQQHALDNWSCLCACDRIRTYPIRLNTKRRIDTNGAYSHRYDGCIDTHIENVYRCGSFCGVAYNASQTRGVNARRWKLDMCANSIRRCWAASVDVANRILSFSRNATI